MLLPDAVHFGRGAVFDSKRKQLKAVLKQAKKKGENIAKLIEDLQFSLAMFSPFFACFITAFKLFPL